MPSLFKKTSFRYFIGYLSILLIPIIICAIVFYSIETRMREELERYGYSILNQIKIGVDEKLYGIKQKTMDAAMDRCISRFSNIGTKLDIFDIETLLETQALLDKIKNTSSFISEAYIVNYRGGFILTGGGKTSLVEYYDRHVYTQAGGGDEWVRLQSGLLRQSFIFLLNAADLKQYIAFIQPIPLIVGDNESPKAAFVILIDSDIINREYRQLASIAQPGFYIIDSSGQAVTGSDEEWSYDIDKLDNSSGSLMYSNDQILYFIDSDACAWTYAWLVNIDSISGNLSLVRAVMTYSLLLAIVLGLVLSLFLTRQNLSSLTDIIRLIRRLPGTKYKANTEEFENIRQGIALLLNNHQSVINNLERQKIFLRGNAVAQLLLDVNQSYENISQMLLWADISFPYSQFLAAIFIIGEADNYPAGENSKNASNVGEAINKCLSDGIRAYTCELSYFIIGAIVNTDIGIDEIKSLFDRVSEECAFRYEIIVSIFYGDMVDKAVNINKSFEIAQQKRNAAKFKEGASIQDIRDTRIEQYISEHFSDPNLNLDQVAAAFGITPAYLSGLFKSKHGESFIFCLRHMRISKAKELLLTNKTVGQIAEDVGYINANTLIRNFKKDVNMTPGQYRLQNLASGNLYNHNGKDDNPDEVNERHY